MCGFLTFVVIYGVWKTRKTKDLNDYILTSKTTPWYIVAISIMATQASAITFLSTPGQAYVDGMRFIQFYIGLPIAMVILSITAVPLYHKLNVYTAYEYLEHRFDLKNRILGSVLFLIQRGLAAGFTIFAPSLIISLILNWDINITIVLVGVLVIIYTTVGGTIAVNKTHIQQMAIIFIGMIAAFITIIYMLPENVSFFNAAVIAGKMGKLNTIDFSFNFLVGTDWRYFLNVIIFWNRSVSSAALFGRKLNHTKQIRFACERNRKNPDAGFYFIHRCNGICFLSVHYSSPFL